jgi:hypothetical protein
MVTRMSYKGSKSSKAIQLIFRHLFEETGGNNKKSGPQ